VCLCSGVAEVFVFHDTLGLTAPVRRFAGELHAAGHTVHTPDLYDGRTFETYEDGAAPATESNDTFPNTSPTPTSKRSPTHSKRSAPTHDRSAPAAPRLTGRCSGVIPEHSYGGRRVNRAASGAAAVAGGRVGGGSGSAVVDVCVATRMRRLVPRDRLCDMRSGAVLWRRAWPVRAADSVLSGRCSRRCADGLSSPSR
jgi:hypothetical protein